MNGYREHADVLRTAVLWLEERGGEDAVMRAFEDLEPSAAAWGLKLAEFKEVLRALARETLAAERKGTV